MQIFSSKVKLTIVLFWSTCFLIGTCCPVTAESFPGTSDEEQATEAILSTALEILHTNTELCCLKDEVSRFTKVRTALYNTSASTLVGAGLTSVAAERWSTLNDPGRASQAAIEAGPILIITGNSIILGGLISEMLTDKFKSIKKRKSSNTYMAKLNKLKVLYKELSQAEKKRSELDANTTESDIYKRNSKSINELKKLCLMDSIQVLQKIHFNKISKRATLAAECVSSSTAAFLGGLLALIAVSEKEAKVAGPAGIGFIISGATISITPALSRLLGRFYSKRKYRKFQKLLLSDATNTVLIDPSHHQVYRKLSSLESVVEKARVIVLDTRERLQKIDRQQARETVKKTLVNTLVGGTKLSGGVQLTSASYAFDSNKANAGRVFSTKVAAGDTTYIPGAATWLANSFFSRNSPENQVYTFGKQKNDFKAIYAARRILIKNMLLDLKDHKN